MVECDLSSYEMNLFLPEIGRVIPFGVEILMAEDVAVVGQVDFVEIVHVELPDEGGEAVVSVVAGEDAFFQFFLVEDADSFELGIPVDDFRVFFGLR